jgi:hypothetical protein
VEVRPHRRLGGAAQGDHLARREGAPDRSPGSDSGTQSPERKTRRRAVSVADPPAWAVRVGHELLQRRRRRVPEGDRLVAQDSTRRCGSAALGVDQADRAARRQGAEDVVDREVEGQRGDEQQAVAGPISKVRLTHSTRLTAGRWRTITPFGRPVEPEVKMT